ncbi:MAG: SDR family oxidoreductase [Gammaproteobacteria bacterium]
MAGATGYIGGGVAHSLHSAGISVRALTRDAGRFTPACSTDEVFVGEATQRDSLRGACDGIDAVFSSIGIRAFDRKPSLWDVDYQANINLLEEAQRAGVRHFIFVSVIHGALMARTSPVAKARENVARAIIDSGIPYTIYRPTGFFNDMAEFLDAADNRGFVRLLGTGEGLINPLSAIDMGHEVARAILSPSSLCTERTVGGPETFTHRQIAEMAFRILDKPAKIRRVPRLVLRTAASMIKPLHTNAHAFATFFDFIAATPSMCGDPIGRIRLESFFRLCATGMSLRDAERSLDGEFGTHGDGELPAP